MKWFKHLSSAYTDLAIRQIIEEFGIEGYGIYWLCCELVAQQGDHFQLRKKQNWFEMLQLISKTTEPKLSKILQKLAELNLIDTKAYKRGNLYLKKMGKYADDYTESVVRGWRHSSDNVPPDKKRIDKKRREERFSSKKKLFYGDLEVREAQGKLWVIPKDGGDWLEYAGKKSDLIEK